ncbi:MAG: ABC transporter ATP-binding protein [bacterium]|nr:ABC transporter ATP-binding protein [bacterium]
MENKILKVTDLSIGFEENKQFTEVVKKISFDVGQGEIVGIVGESGSGKSLTSLTIMDLLSHTAKVNNGSILFEDKDLLTISTEEKRKLKGKDISMVFQEPMTSLNPLLKVGPQVEEVLVLHKDGDRNSYRKRVISMFQDVGLPNPEELYEKYPHQLSGGMRQRVMIAMAMILQPKLLIADEPTTALDVTIQKQILDLLLKMNQKYGTSIIFISHDLGVVKKLCNRVIVMCEGEIVEQGQIATIFTNPKEAYTKKLLAAVPSVKANEAFGEIAVTAAEKKSSPVLSVKDLKVSYKVKSKGLFKKAEEKRIVKGVSFTVNEGEIFGIVGESGCGKSTLSKAIVGLNRHTEGVLELKEANPQMVFQDPYSSLNPAKTIGAILSEPLIIEGKLTSRQRMEKVEQMLEEVGLPKDYYKRNIAKLSGGQRQRVAIALALMTNKKFIVLDEPVSALDVTIQDQILRLLKRLREEYNLSYLFISHDLNVVYELCDRIAVMKDGVIVEQGTKDEIYYRPKADYTKQLLSAIL